MVFQICNYQLTALALYDKFSDIVWSLIVRWKIFDTPCVTQRMVDNMSLQIKLFDQWPGATGVRWTVCSFYSLLVLFVKDGLVGGKSIVGLAYLY